MGRPLPVRTTADTNSPNDINTLSSAIEDMIDGSTAFESITFINTTGTAGLHTESDVLKFKGATIATGSMSGQGLTFKLGGNAYVGTKQDQRLIRL
jgi:hypothetical protein